MIYKYGKRFRYAPSFNNLNWIKIYDINHNLIHFLYFQFRKKIFWKYATHKWPFYDYFWQLRYNTSKN